MTNISNEPADFASDMVAGVASAYARYLRLVPAGGVVRHIAGGDRATRVVLGGGSGHFPWTGGFVGPGIADGAVLGDVFASPSSEQIYRVVRALGPPASVLFCYGNYAGDVLHFDMAQERLRGEGVDCRTVRVTDDVASAPPTDAERRRGIAGSVMVFKVAGAAAARGDSLDDVERFARRANTRTRTIGAAFSGCTLPGQAEPLFRVEPGAMAIGLGIHGEPGVRTVDRMPARELARTLVGALLAEAPPDASGRAAVMLNGLGATGQDELFVLWASVARELAAAGIEPVLPEVGEFVTSLNMSGCSLSVGWLDEELEELWSAPADTPAFRRDLRGAGALGAPPRVDAAVAPVDAREQPATRDGSDPGLDVVRRALTAMLRAVGEAEQELGRLDAVAGDGDHGVGMTRGLRAAVDAAARHHADVVSQLRAAGAAWSDKGGGTSGALWGVLLSGVADSLARDEADAGHARIVAAIRAGAEKLQQVGGASLGDKTMLDVLVPFVDALDASVANGEALGPAWSAATLVAGDAAQRTAQLRPRIGRARALAGASVGSPDPGAVSMALCLRAVEPVLSDAATIGG
jgi:D-erythrulose 4-kinase